MLTSGPGPGRTSGSVNRRAVPRSPGVNKPNESHSPSHWMRRQAVSQARSPRTNNQLESKHQTLGARLFVIRHANNRVKNSSCINHFLPTRISDHNKTNLVFKCRTEARMLW